MTRKRIDTTDELFAALAPHHLARAAVEDQRVWWDQLFAGNGVPPKSDNTRAIADAARRMNDRSADDAAKYQRVLKESTEIVWEANGAVALVSFALIADLAREAASIHELLAGFADYAELASRSAATALATMDDSVRAELRASGVSCPDPSAVAEAVAVFPMLAAHARARVAELNGIADGAAATARGPITAVLGRADSLGARVGVPVLPAGLVQLLREGIRDEQPAVAATAPTSELDPKPKRGRHKRRRSERGPSEADTSARTLDRERPDPAGA